MIKILPRYSIYKTSYLYHTEELYFLERSILTKVLHFHLFPQSPVWSCGAYVSGSTQWHHPLWLFVLNYTSLSHGPCTPLFRRSFSSHTFHPLNVTTLKKHWSQSRGQNKDLHPFYHCTVVRLRNSKKQTNINYVKGKVDIYYRVDLLWL